MKSKEQRRQEAIMRQKEYDNMTPLQKLSRLDGLFGYERGARKERNRLTSDLCQFTRNNANMYRLSKGMELLPVHIDPYENRITSEQLDQIEKEMDEHSNPPLVRQDAPIIPPTRTRLVIPTEGREQEPA